MKKALFLLTALILLIVFAACNASAPEPAKNEKSEQEPKTKESETPAEPVEPEEDQIPQGIKLTNILLIGSMEKDFSDDSADAFMLTHILLTLDPQNRTLKFTTFPYNLGLDVQTDGNAEIMQPQFICSTFGEDKTVNIFEKNFDIDIDYWVVMNMHGVINIVDAIKGIEIDISELSINEAAEHLIDFLGIVWDEITQTGLQMLSGAQTSGYFVDTIQYDNDNWLEDEELLFRDRHENIINAVIKAVKLTGLKSEDLITIADNIKNNYATNIPDTEWQIVADTAIYCLENDAQHLHIPEVIDTQEHDGRPPMIFDKDKDVAAVQEFAGEQ